MKIPETYVLNKFYAYSGDPEFKKFENTYNAGCPVCKEGRSWGSKKRLYYYPQSNSFYCFNCSRSWNALNWLCEACGMSPDEIYGEITDNKHSFEITKKIKFKDETKPKKPISDLPHDSINLFDDVQFNFYKNKSKYVSIAYEYIKSRKLDVAINKPNSLYISLTDFYHKNRLCIPFKDTNKKIVFYQSRSLDSSMPKYLSKLGSDKSLFGIEKVDNDLEYIFIFEGPIDAMFVKNGVAAAGLTLTKNQSKQLLEFPFHKKIWVLDNPKFDKTSEEKMKKMISNNETVFLWPSDMNSKDFNEYAVSKNYNQIDHNLIVENSLNLTS